MKRRSGGTKTEILVTASTRAQTTTIPRHSMYGIFTYIGVVWGVNVGIYGIHGVSGIGLGF